MTLLRRLWAWLLHIPHDVDPDFEQMRQWGKRRFPR